MLLSVHLNDNGIYHDEESYNSLLEIFRNDRELINENKNKDSDLDPRNFKLNKYVANEKLLKETVNYHSQKVTSEEVLTSDPSTLGIHEYQEHLLKSKQSKVIA